VIKVFTNFDSVFEIVRMKSKEKIYINSETRISQILNGFNAAFPFLRIEIYKKGEVITLDHRDFRLFEIAGSKEPKDFTIHGELKVSEIEQLFFLNLGLKVAIFRKMGTSTVETTFTSQWTLNHQNCKGEEIYLTI
jgi:hypothetical protein